MDVLTAIRLQMNRLNNAHLPPKATSSPNTLSTSLGSGPSCSCSCGPPACDGVLECAGAGDDFLPPWVYDWMRCEADERLGSADVVEFANVASVIGLALDGRRLGKRGGRRDGLERRRKEDDLVSPINLPTRLSSSHPSTRLFTALSLSPTRRPTTAPIRPRP